MIHTCLVFAVSFLAPFCPHPLDKGGWALRLHNLRAHGPYLVGESIDSGTFDVTLINYSKETRKHDPLSVANALGDLDVTVFNVQHVPIDNVCRLRFPKRDPLTEPIELRPGDFSCCEFSFISFGYYQVWNVGKHRIQATMKIGGKTIVAPEVTFEVIDAPEDAILFSHRLPVEGIAARPKPEDQLRPFVQQIRVGKRTVLFYRLYEGLKRGDRLVITNRITELPGRVEMKVEGAFGAGNPLTIKYKDAKPKTGWTTIVINSIDGMPWTEEEERLRVKRAKSTTPPAPRPVRP